MKQKPCAGKPHASSFTIKICAMLKRVHEKLRRLQTSKMAVFNFSYKWPGDCLNVLYVKML